MALPSNAKVAVTQLEPCWYSSPPIVIHDRFDLEAAVEKTIKYIKEASENGADLIAFPECWIPGYPTWIWDYPVNPPLLIKYIRNSLNVSSPQMSRLCSA